MINYDQYKNDADFMTILNELRSNCLSSADEIVDRTDLDWDVVDQHFDLAQAIVAEELEHGIVFDPYGASIVEELKVYFSQH
ncbi:hypothetical protein [Trueperella bialowiezensis]|uniref:Uncharacterized protein n=1 Tax=Trueperella bialowiezensis TaxID=312285 RepID=A0A448PG00_9ACTO|nr:hypothetical protein [Trueperella bialowiezensis]VEI13855.1 Uncharacterised protein [Trueperella bialowiezensis]